MLGYIKSPSIPSWKYVLVHIFTWRLVVFLTKQKQITSKQKRQFLQIQLQIFTLNHKYPGEGRTRGKNYKNTAEPNNYKKK